MYMHIYTHIYIHTQLMPGADVVIDFSLPEGTKICAKRAEELGMYLN
jgi:dihydrodipicolinate reductase